MSPSTRNLALVVLLVGIAIGWCHSGSHPGAGPSEPRPQESAAAPSAARQGASDDHAPGSLATLSALEEKIGMKSTVAVADDSNYYVDVVVAAPRRCGPGDLDIILLDAQHRKEPALVLSLEPLAGTRGPAAISVPLARLNGGFHHRFVVPRQDALQPYGLYLCAQGDNPRTCQAKALVDPNYLTQAYSGGAGVPAEPAPIFFFQLISFHHGRMAAFQKGLVAQTGYQLLPEYLSTVPEGPRVADAIRAHTQTIGSLPVDFGLAVRIDIPGHDPKLCPGYQEILRLPERKGGK